MKVCQENRPLVTFWSKAEKGEKCDKRTVPLSHLKRGWGCTIILLKEE